MAKSAPFDVVVHSFKLDLSGLLGATNQTYAKPRTWGASVTLRY